MQKLEEEVKSVIGEQLGIKISELENSKHFIKDLRADSMDMVGLLMVLEEKLSITIEDHDAERLETIQDVLDYVSEKKSLPN